MLGLGGTGQSTALAQRAVLTDSLPESAPAPAQKAGKPGRTALFAVGALLLLLFAAGIIIQRASGNETSKTTQVSEGQPAASSAKEEAKESTKSKSETSKEVSKDVPSEGVLLGLLGTGVLLILAGGLYSRLTTIKLPGGAELDLSSELTKDEGEKVQEAVVAKAEEKVPAGSPDPTKVAEATVISRAVARAHKRATGEALSDEISELAADIGVKAAGFR